MARILGVEIPRDKRSVIALTYLYGIGKKTAIDILASAKISEDKRVADLSANELADITRIISDQYKIEGDLRAETRLNIKRQKDSASYRGIRHREFRKVRGQKTRNSGRMMKGQIKKRPIANKKKAGK